MKRQNSRHEIFWHEITYKHSAMQRVTLRQQTVHSRIEKKYLKPNRYVRKPHVTAVVLL